MITTSDISEIAYDLCRVFGVTTYITNVFPNEEVREERIVIIPKAISGGTYWKRSFCEVNWCVPDINEKADLSRLKEVERTMADILKNGCGVKSDTTYRYSVNTSQVVDEGGLKIHYANVQLLFEQLNTL